MHSAPRVVWLLILALAAWGSSALCAPIPQNQCPGDCSPCLGATDPFCSTTTIDDTNKSNFCVYCDSPKGNCHDSQPGQSGYDKSCTVVTSGMTVISCTTSGSACTGSTVTP